MFIQEIGIILTRFTKNAGKLRGNTVIRLRDLCLLIVGNDTFIDVFQTLFKKRSYGFIPSY